MDEPQKPSLGRIVHYVEEGPGDLPGDVVEHAAIVTRVSPDGGGTHVDLTVFTAWFETHQKRVAYAPPEDRKPQSWHWPERV